MSDEKKGPEYFSTKQIPKVEVPQNQVSEILTILRGVTGKVDTIADGQVELTTRVSRIEDELEQVKQRQNNSSMRAKSSTDADLAHDAALAAQASRQLELEKNAEATLRRVSTVETKVDKLDAGVALVVTKTAEQTAILERLDKIAANPLVRRIAYGLAMALVGWLTLRGYIR
jgi:hypothetical protein